MLHLGALQDHLRRTQVSHRGLLRTRIRDRVDSQLLLLTLVHLLPDHGLHRAVLWKPLREDGSYVLSSPGKLPVVLCRKPLVHPGLNH